MLWVQRPGKDISNSDLTNGNDYWNMKIILMVHLYFSCSEGFFPPETYSFSSVMLIPEKCAHMKEENDTEKVQSSQHSQQGDS